jgi:scyllo-inositol 2-dehydrogenase (NADP+)
LRVVIIGLGSRGKRHLEVVGNQVVATVDPFNENASYKDIRELNPDSYDIAIIATDEKSKVDLIENMLLQSKHVLVEKPLLTTISQLQNWDKKAAEKRLILRVAYNHRYEFGVSKLHAMIESRQLGRIYRLSIFYGNGTAQNIKSSLWRNSLKAVSTDLLSHTLDLAMFLLNANCVEVKQLFESSYEIDGADHAILVGKTVGVDLLLEASYISWKNFFQIELIAEYGSIKIRGLDKWGNHEIEEIRRVFPSGAPSLINHETPPKYDSTSHQWNAFLNDIKLGNFKTNLERDISILKALT